VVVVSFRVGWGFNGAVECWFLGDFVEVRRGMVEVKWLWGACGHSGVAWCRCRYNLQQGKWGEAWEVRWSYVEVSWWFGGGLVYGAW